MDLGFHLRRAMETGKVFLGYRQSEKLLLNGRAKLVILSSWAREDIKENILHLCDLGKVPVFIFEGKTTELGHICNKPFGVAVIAVEDEGDSRILELVGRDET